MPSRGPSRALDMAALRHADEDDGMPHPWKLEVQEAMIQTDLPIAIGLGELLWDCFVDSRRPGGAPANVAFHACQLGCRGVVCSRVGRDRLGDELVELESSGHVDFAKAILREFGVHTVCITREIADVCWSARMRRPTIPAFRSGWPTR